MHRSSSGCCRGTAALASTIGADAARRRVSSQLSQRPGGAPRAGGRDPARQRDHERRRGDLRGAAPVIRPCQRRSARGVAKAKPPPA